MKKTAFKVAIVGASGMVGRSFIKVLEERKFPLCELTLFASARSAGEQIDFCGKAHTVLELTHSSFAEHKVDIALFSAGGSVSAEYAPIAAASGAVVIDNSSCWRMDDGVPLIVPEVNAHALVDYTKKSIIANPNCSTIQAMPVLKPLHGAYGLKRVVYSTYQAVSGAGMAGVSDLKTGECSKFPHPITNNCLPHIDVFTESGYTKEEQKMIDETRKILGLPNLRVTATAVRVPVLNGHAESVNVEFDSEFELSSLRELLSHAPGVVLQDDYVHNLYPMPLTASGHDEVFVGRIRRDFSVASGVNLFIAADNIRKGAATNAVQIAEELLKLL